MASGGATDTTVYTPYSGSAAATWMTSGADQLTVSLSGVPYPGGITGIYIDASTGTDTATLSINDDSGLGTPSGYNATYTDYAGNIFGAICHALAN